jgi:integration host factor subunit alpha
MELSVDNIETQALTKAQLSEQLFDRIGLNKREAKDMVDAFFDVITAELVLGNEVKITGFGNFQIRAKQARPGRNPRTKELVPIEARHVVVFHASKMLKSLMQIDETGGGQSASIESPRSRSAALPGLELLDSVG